MLALLVWTQYYNLLSFCFSFSHRRRMFLEPTAIKSSCYLLTEGRTELRTYLSSTTGPIRRSDHHFPDMIWFISSFYVERLVFLLCCCLLEVCVPHNYPFPPVKQLVSCLICRGNCGICDGLCRSVCSRSRWGSTIMMSLRCSGSHVLIRVRHVLIWKRR